jgi:hypothetical protein
VNGDRARRALISAERYYGSRLGATTSTALDEARRAANLSAATRALRRGDYSAALDALFPESAQRQLASDLNVAAIRVMLASATRAMRNDVPTILRTSIGGPTHGVLHALERLDLTRVSPLVDGSDHAVRSVLTIGLQEGMNPVDVARWARDAIGLTPHDIDLAQSFEAQLRGAPTDALARTLRDARFDSTLRAAALGETTLASPLITTMRERYVDRLQTFRVETFTRTTTLDALRQGQLAAWFDASEAAGVDTEQLVKTWITTLDGRERPEHHDAHGLTVPLDELFPVDGGVEVPGEGVYNCRCAFTVRLLPAGRDAAQRFLATRERRFAAQRGD